MVDGEKIIKGAVCKYGKIILVGSKSFFCVDIQKRPVLVIR